MVARSPLLLLYGVPLSSTTRWECTPAAPPGRGAGRAGWQAS